jgi:hypothetical protein
MTTRRRIFTPNTAVTKRYMKLKLCEFTPDGFRAGHIIW